MTLHLSGDEVAKLGAAEVALAAMRTSFAVERRGDAVLPVRLDTPSDNGFLRAMPAVLGDVMGCKIMTLARGHGTRYLVILCDSSTGEMLALIDADELTRIRTAATTLLAAQLLRDEPMHRLAIIGTGSEASGHLEMFAQQVDLDRVTVFSRSADNRRRFVDTMAERTGLAVHDAGSAAEAVAEADTVLLATHSPVPVIDGSHLPSGSLILSIGSTRPDLRELDTEAIGRARMFVVDAVEQVVADSGDVRAAIEAGALSPSDIVGLAHVADGTRPPVRPGVDRDLTVFKSAGTALQDLAFASALLRSAEASSMGTDIGTVARLKPFVSAR